MILVKLKSHFRYTENGIFFYVSHLIFKMPIKCITSFRKKMSITNRILVPHNQLSMKTKLLLLLLFANFSLYAQTNLVLNGGFESWIAGSPQNWTIANSVSSSTDKSEGQYSAKLSLTDKTLAPKVTSQVLLKAGKTYIINFKYKYLNSNYSGLHPIALKIFQNGSGTMVSKSFLASDNNWTEKEISFTPDMDLSYELSISVFSFDDETFDVLIDDVSVVDIDEPEHYTLIPDVNFENKLISLGIDSGAPDGKVLTSNAALRTSLDISKSSITDLTGIEAFVSLTTLYCDNNQLTTINLSQNTKLTDLNVAENQLTSLDINSNVLLKELDCQRNQITDLNVSKNIKLVSLKAMVNQLTALELSYNTLLTELDVSSNKLINLNIDNNTALKKLICEKNSLTSLNTSNNTLLTSFGCHYNKITSLDVSQNILLTEFVCVGNKLTTINVSKNTELNIFDCYENQITSIDISKNSKITEFACNDNQLTYLNVKNGNNINFKLYYTNFINNPSLTCIEVDDVNYSKTNWSAKKDFTANYNIDCTPYTLIPDPNFEKKLIALGIDSGTPDGKVMTSKISPITSLDLYNSNITDLTGIEDFQSLTNLSCMSNKIINIDISKNVALTNLNVGYNQLTALNTSQNTNLQYLSLSYNEIASLNLAQNSELILLACNSNKLTNIDLSNNKKLSSLWCPSNQLTSLDLSKNTLLTSLLCSENKPLKSVDLRNGNNSRAVLNLYNIDFTKNPELTCILVDDALFSNKKWESFKDPSASYSTVDCAQVTTIPDPAFEEKLIAMNIDTDGKNGSVLNSSIANITSLDVSSSTIKDLTGIKGFTSLSNLNCSGNLLSTLDLSQNKTLKVINCSNNILIGLDLKNGNHNNLTLTSNFTNNPNLTCIQVDDANYSEANWTTLKDATANYNVDCIKYTLIPDSNFEDKLIALEIDKDGKNGKVKTASISQVVSLNLQSSNISDLTGIEDFQALLYLDCKYNTIRNINVEHNKALRGLDLHDNELSSLNISANTALFSLTFSKNQISTIDLSQNKDLQNLTCDRNLLKDLDISLNTQLRSLYCGNTDLTVLDVSNQPNLLDLNCTNTKISKLDVTSNTKLENLYFNNAQLTTLDLSNNPLLKRINLSWNKLTSLDLSHNPLLELVFLEFNPLTTLNVQNGNNKNFILPSQTGKNADATIYTSFLGNKTLGCIQVDDADYSNANWEKIKEKNATYSNTCKNLGIEANVFEKATIYPNPTKGEVNIQNVNLEKATVYNSLGQLVKTFKLNSSNTTNTITLSGLPKGVYYIYLINQDAASAKKIIVE